LSINTLHKLITETHKNEKVLVFTQFADTAYYLTEELKKRGVTLVESVTGDNEHPTTLAQRFSPVSNQKHELKEKMIREAELLARIAELEK
jgi:ERCC4-related helicase